MIKGSKKVYFYYFYSLLFSFKHCLYKRTILASSKNLSVRGTFFEEHLNDLKTLFQFKEQRKWKDSVDVKDSSRTFIFMGVSQ